MNTLEHKRMELDNASMTKAFIQNSITNYVGSHTTELGRKPEDDFLKAKKVELESLTQTIEKLETQIGALNRSAATSWSVDGITNTGRRRS